MTILTFAFKPLQILTIELSALYNLFCFAQLIIKNLVYDCLKEMQIKYTQFQTMWEDIVLSFQKKFQTFLYSGLYLWSQSAGPRVIE